MNLNAAQTKTVASPNNAYNAYVKLWAKVRAVCGGERFVKDYDKILYGDFRNLLIPFSTTMTQDQYNIYKAEAELPGIVAQFCKLIVGGLLRKPPVITLPDNIDKKAYDWISKQFGQDDSPITSFLEEALFEELQTSRAWIAVDYPVVENPDSLDKADKEKLKPYPILWQAEKVINWRVRPESQGKVVLDRVITRELIEDFRSNEFHPNYIDRVSVHELNEKGNYQIRVFEKESLNTDLNPNNQAGQDTTEFKFVKTHNILVNDENLTFIPAWPLNGNIAITEPVLMPIIDKEISLYNKLSRRNHLLYGAATYTPVITGDITDEQFEEIVSAGLGSWLKLPTGSTAEALETPTSALADMDRAILANIEEMAKLGIRMLTPEVSQSGVALEIRNASQTAQLGSLSIRIGNVFSQVIAFMLNWRYDLELLPTDVGFVLSEDFEGTPLGSDWARLATEWYQSSLIPRSLWLTLMKKNEIVPTDYDDEKGQVEITQDSLVASNRNLDVSYEEQLKAEKLGLITQEQ